MATSTDADQIGLLVATALADKVRPAFGDRGAAAVAALVRRDLPRTSVRYVVAESGGAIVGTARLALSQEMSDTGLRPIARAVGWRYALRGAVALGLLVHARLGPDEAYVEELAVDADHRRRGIGRALMRECEQIARRSDKHRVTLWVTAGNHGAISLYRQLGYRITRRRRTLRGRFLFGAPVAVLMEKRLPANPGILAT